MIARLLLATQSCGTWQAAQEAALPMRMNKDIELAKSLCQREVRHKALTEAPAGAARSRLAKGNGWQSSRAQSSIQGAAAL